MIRTVPERPPSHGEDGPLDPERPNPDSARPGAEAPAGLLAQLKAVRAAAVRVVGAHIELARAEADQIKGEVLRTLALGGLAAVCLVFLAFLLVIGLSLFLGEWLFGSLGWGVLHGAELFIAVAVIAVLLALRSRGVGAAVAIALITALVVTVVFGTNVLNTIYVQIAGQFATSADPGDISFAIGAGIGAAIFAVVGLLAGARGGTAGSAAGGLFAGAVLGALLGVLAAGLVRLAIKPASRPMIVGLLIWAAVGAIAGLIAGWQRDGRTALVGLGAGLVIGGFFGAFSAIAFSWHVSIAIGLAVFYALAPAIAGAYAANGGIDIEALKARYWPAATIDTTKETIEWAKGRLPGGGGS